MAAGKAPLRCERCGVESGEDVPRGKFALYAIERLSAAPWVIALCPRCDKETTSPKRAAALVGVTQLSNP